ncbi:hypothetical protein OO7_02296 [Providencia sneebia DSM 19967]|uniref:Uncharacterized protein n=1 Tax=Providencia sneebia DSM 19967 TaxID=1141660 RepID=K8WK32_9GAMM|nr:hypothetical protein OO7_02296 [Providencia sneebia DSM 19967]
MKWKKIKKDNTIIYLIQGKLNDYQLIAISNFAQQFYHQWGEKYIKFSISILENKLEGKSFIINQSDFTLIDNNHWSFISNKTY